MAPSTAIAHAAATASALALLMTPAAAATTATVPGTKIAIPATAQPQRTSSTGTVTERAPSTPSPNGAQPGTVAPGSSSTPTATIPPATTTPSPSTGAAPPSGTSTVAPTSTSPGAPATLGIVHRPARKHKSGLSNLAIVLAAIGALLILASLVWALARWLALQPRWTSSLTYSLREASYHTSATWAEFSDWARIGR